MCCIFVGTCLWRFLNLNQICTEKNKKNKQLSAAKHHFLLRCGVGSSCHSYFCKHLFVTASQMINGPLWTFYELFFYIQTYTLILFLPFFLHCVFYGTLLPPTAAGRLV